MILRYRALMFDEKGNYHGNVGFSKDNPTFKYGKGTYNVQLENCSFFESKPIPFILKRRTFFYNISNSNPIVHNKKCEPIINPELYNIQLENKVARDLNNLSNDGLMSFLTPRNLLIGAVIIGIIYYLTSGGTPTQVP